MLREGNIQKLTWADKTMSVLRARQLEACEKRLLSFPEVGLFSGCSEHEVSALWDLSLEAEQHPAFSRMLSMHELQTKVMIGIPAEAALLSWPEEQLIGRLVIGNGKIPLNDPEDYDAAELLIRRFWCYLTRENGLMILHLPLTLLAPLSHIFSSEEHRSLRGKLVQLCTRIQSVLYIHGVLLADQPLNFLCSESLKDTYANDPALAKRFLLSSYDYTYLQDHRLLLMHPGVADPFRLDPFHQGWKDQLEDERLYMSAEGILPEERPLYSMMFGLLQQAVRPEISEEEAVSDLVMLCKQGVSFNELKEVLSSLLCVLPTEQMLTGLHCLLDGIPRWSTLHSGVMQ